MRSQALRGRSVVEGGRRTRHALQPRGAVLVLLPLFSDASHFSYMATDRLVWDLVDQETWIGSCPTPLTQQWAVSDQPSHQRHGALRLLRCSR